MQAALVASRAGTSVQEDQTSACGAAAAPHGLAEADAPTVVLEPEPEDDGLVAASCAAAADPVVRVRKCAKAAGGTEESMEAMLPQMLVRAHQAGQSAALKLAGASRVEATLKPPKAYKERHFFVLLRGVNGVQVGMFQRKYQDFQGYVRNGKAIIWHLAVFHGFHTKAEAEEYWKGAGQTQPCALLEPRPWIECTQGAHS